MASRYPQLRHSFLLMGAGVALALVLILGAITAHQASGTLQRQADDRGRDVAARVAIVITEYVRERHHEAEALAASPPVIRAALDAAQLAVDRRLVGLDRPTLERMI